ncbi:MAG: hypothetical protein IOC80_04300 [Rhodobacter sp.]|nr:hypothetical protein [Rhodobacter sp.]MCA3526424.1 hypothetical protein [Rhodobacter sp.]MCA3529634.1 hypothetical protein [Rhodobacter sp.]MCA3531506.1 hypothetical protein [Rhodobacter sp.]MCA3536120.1 hypothetical protein [Rhodobacter sp.]
MTFNRKQIMTLAWAWARQDLWSLRLPASHLRRLFNDALRRAWAEAKEKARQFSDTVKSPSRPVAQIEAEICTLENRDGLRHPDFERLAALNLELRAARLAA